MINKYEFNEINFNSLKRENENLKNLFYQALGLTDEVYSKLREARKVIVYSNLTICINCLIIIFLLCSK